MAVRVEVESKDMDALLRSMENAIGDRAQKIVGRAAKRAALAARTAATKRIRAIYTIKARDMKGHTRIQAEKDGATIYIQGAMEPVQSYKARKNRKGVFVAVKKGSGRTVQRSFVHGRRFMQREGDGRLPIRGLYGPAVPQLFGNEDVVAAMEERGLGVFEERLLHEFGRLLGGAVT